MLPTSDVQNQPGNDEETGNAETAECSEMVSRALLMCCLCEIVEINGHPKAWLWLPALPKCTCMSGRTPMTFHMRDDGIVEITF